LRSAGLDIEDTKSEVGDEGEGGGRPRVDSGSNGDDREHDAVVVAPQRLYMLCVGSIVQSVPRVTRVCAIDGLLPDQYPLQVMFIDSDTLAMTGTGGLVSIITILPTGGSTGRDRVTVFHLNQDPVTVSVRDEDDPGSLGTYSRATGIRGEACSEFVRLRHCFHSIESCVTVFDYCAVADRLLVTGDTDGVICAWRVPQLGKTDRAPIAQPLRLHSRIFSIKISPTGKSVATSTVNQLFLLYFNSEGLGNNMYIRSVLDSSLPTLQRALYTVDFREDYLLIWRLSTVEDGGGVLASSWTHPNLEKPAFSRLAVFR